MRIGEYVWIQGFSLRETKKDARQKSNTHANTQRKPRNISKLKNELEQEQPKYLKS